MITLESINISQPHSHRFSRLGFRRRYSSSIFQFHHHISVMQLTPGNLTAATINVYRFSSSPVASYLFSITFGYHFSRTLVMPFGNNLGQLNYFHRELVGLQTRSVPHQEKKRTFQWVWAVNASVDSCVGELSEAGDVGEKNLLSYVGNCTEIYW